MWLMICLTWHWVVLFLLCLFEFVEHLCILCCPPSSIKCLEYKASDKTQILFDFQSAHSKKSCLLSASACGLNNYTSLKLEIFHLSISLAISHSTLIGSPPLNMFWWFLFFLFVFVTFKPIEMQQARALLCKYMYFWNCRTNCW